MSYLSPTQTRAGAPSLAPAVGAELARLEGRLGQWADPGARERLARLGESAAARVLRTIGESRTPVKTLSGYIRHLAEKEAMERNARGIPPAESAACSSGPSEGDESVSGPQYHSDDQYDVQSPYREEITLGLSNHAGYANQWRPIGSNKNEGLVREIAHVVPNLSAMAAQIPSGWVSLQNQNDTQINSPIRAMAPATMPPVATLPCTVGQNQFRTTPAMMPVPTLPWMAGENPKDWISSRNLDYSHSSAVPPSVWNQIPMQINSPVRAMPPNVMVQGGSPGHHVPIGLHNHMRTGSPIPNSIHTPPTSVSTPIRARDISGRVQGIAVPSGSPQSPACAGMSSPATYCATSNASREKASPQMEALDGMEFRKIFLIFQYLSGRRIEDELSVEYIRSLQCLPMVHFESGIWNTIGRKYIKNSDRAKNLDSDPGTARVYHCNVEIKGDCAVTVFKGPYVETKRTHLAKVVGDDNVLVVKFVGESSKDDFVPHFKIAEDGIFLGLRRYRYFALRAMIRFALILSKTITLEADLSAVRVIQLDDKPCSDKYGNIIVQDEEPLIHTDGTGLISEDLAMKCSTSISEINYLKKQEIVSCDETPSEPSRVKRRRSIAPLLTQFRMFYKGAAVKGTALVDRRLPPGTILIRPSMIKIKSDPELCGVQSVNSLELMTMKTDPKLYGVRSVDSFEIVTTSNQPKRTLTSKYLITLLYYGGVKAEYFIELLHDAIEGAQNARYGYHDALKLAYIYADMEDSISVRMILSGVPLEDAYLQSRLAIMAQQERKGLKEGKLPISDCFYLMGTTDPTGKLRSNEVCQFKPSKPWIQKIKEPKPPQKCPQDFNELDLERSLFHEFLKARFARSSALSTAADCWLVYMDRLITDDLDEGERKVIEKKMEKLVDYYYLALDAPKAGMKINIPYDLIVREYPHFMDRKQCYHSKSILGRIYDDAEKVQSENVGPIEISLDPRFKEREGSAKYRGIWAHHYRQYLKESGPLINIQDKKEVDLKFKELYLKYKHMLYHAAEFEQTPRNLDDVFDEACAIYQIVYERARDEKKPGKCGFAWTVAGRVLCHFYALETDGDKVLVPLSVAKNLLTKIRK
uniref:Uncharacterized protein n=1 Tax=Avena sativa TaxID=4498 RepID=A0ACD5VZG3_AVESA